MTGPPQMLLYSGLANRGWSLRGVGLDGLRGRRRRQLLHSTRMSFTAWAGDLLRIRGHAGHFVADVLGFAGKDGLIQHRLMGQRSDEHGGRAVPQLGGGIFKGAHRAHAGRASAALVSMERTFAWA